MELMGHGRECNSDYRALEKEGRRKARCRDWRKFRNVRSGYIMVVVITIDSALAV